MKLHPAWLAEFHRQWMSARGNRVEPALKAFTRDWEELLDNAGVKSAEDRQAAVREAEKLTLFTLHRRNGRAYQVLKIELPVAAESWLHDLFGSQPAVSLQERSLRILGEWAGRSHPLLPDLWAGLVQSVAEAFQAARGLGPFSWKEPERVHALLGLLFQLTACEWREGTLIRDVSSKLCDDSKRLEREESFLVRGLELLFGRETPLEALGIQTTNSTLHFSGPLTLHFADGTTHETTMLRFESSMPVAELERASHVSTTAERLLTVENRKTTFLQLAHADIYRNTLIVATSFPTQAVRQLLVKLPSALPHFHFGDTDAAGFHILQKLRQVTPRGVRPFQMVWRDKADSRSITLREGRILEALLADPAMADCHSALRAMQNAGRVGGFEQESLGRPSLPAWPFYP